MPRQTHSYRLHTTSGQAIVKVKGRVIYLGKYESSESVEKYQKILASLDPPKSCSVAELLTRFVGHLRLQGVTNGRCNVVATLLRRFVAIYGDFEACDINIKHLKSYRAILEQEGTMRIAGNSNLNVVKQMLKYAAQEGIISPLKWAEFSLVEGLKRGRSKNPDKKGIGPADPVALGKIWKYLKPQTKDAVRLQLYTGMRPSEALSVRLIQVKPFQGVYIYRPEKHKTAYLGKSKAILIPRKAYALIQRWPNGIGVSFKGYALRLMRASRKAGVKTISPNQFRHTFATMLRKRLGIEKAQIALGHSSLNTTEIYAERDLQALAKLL